jgi:hypothetical protein
MTAQGGDHGEEYRADADQPRPGEHYPHPPVDPQAPVNYPEFAPPYPPLPPYPAQPPYPPQPPYPSQPPPGPPYGYPPPPPGGQIGYGGPPPYPGSYDPYQVYQGSSGQTNGLAVASLTTSILAIPLSLLGCLGLPLAIAGIVLGIVSLRQVNRTPQQGRGLAIAGIVIGSIVTALLLVLLVLFGLMTTAVLHSPVM